MDPIFGEYYGPPPPAIVWVENIPYIVPRANLS